MRCRVWFAIACLAAGGGLVLGGGAAGAATAPANDDVAQALTVDVNSSQNQDTTQATTVASDPKHSCTGSADANTVWFAFVPPEDGTLTVDTFGSDYDTVASVYAGTPGALVERACNDDFEGPQSQLSLRVAASESLLIEVSGRGQTPGGRLVLDVYFEPRSACTVVSLPAAGGTFLGSTYGGTSRLTGNGNCDATDIAPEEVFEWTPDRSGPAIIDTCSDETDFDTVLYLRTFGCLTGAQVACGDDECPNDTGINYASRITPTVIAGQTYYIVVDGFGPDSGDFGLNVSPPPCPEATDLGSAASTSISGSTAGAADVLRGSCGGQGAPERVFRYTAALAGVYAIDTVSSQLDTILYVRDGDVCGGAELACNDDTSGTSTSSAVTANLSAGQSIAIVVDGAGAASGDFVLHINHTLLATPTRTASSTPTPTVPTPTPPPTATSVATPSTAPSRSPTRSRTPTSTATAQPTASGRSTATPLVTAAPTHTARPVTPTRSATFGSTAAPTVTARPPTGTATPPVTATPSSGTAMPTPTSVATQAPTPSPTKLATASASRTPSAAVAVSPTPSASVTPAPTAACSGDCNGDREVTIDELLALVNIALGNAPVATCAAGDANGDAAITVDEILAAVNRALAGC